MQFAKRFARGAASAAFKLCIFLAAVTAAVSMTFGTPDTLKESLGKSTVYDHIVESVLSQVKQDTDLQAQQGGEQPDVPLDDAAIQSAAKQAFPPELLQRSTETIVDGVYVWLDGDTPTPNFSIDLSGVKQNLANAIGDQALARAQSLPACTRQQVVQLDPNNLDPFSLPCVPPGLNFQAERQKIVDEVASSQEFLKDPVVTADGWKDQNGVSPFEHAKKVPDAFQLFKKLPWIFGILGILLAVALVFLHESKRRGLHVISRTVLLTGLVLLAGVLVSSYFLRNVRPNAGLANTPDLQEAMVALIRALSAAFNRALTFFAVGYTVLGGGGLLALHFTKPKSAAGQPASKSETPQTKDEKPKAHPDSPPKS